MYRTKLKEDKSFMYEEYKKSFDRRCKYCGYTNRVMTRSGKIPCKHWGKYVFLSDREEFKYRLGECIEKDVY